jgi:hypothetical protein
MLVTYAYGLTFKTEKVITKNDIITMCNLLNNRNEYSDLCKFEPENISEGGIGFKFNDVEKNWYKSVRLCVGDNGSRGGWYWISNVSLLEWVGNNDMIFDKQNIFTIFLKSFNGAPLFTIKELEIWEECFGQIDIIRVGKYPSKESLITEINT